MPSFLKKKTKLETFYFFNRVEEEVVLLSFSPQHLHSCLLSCISPEILGQNLLQTTGGEEECEKHISTLCPGFLPLFFGIFTTGRAPLGAENRLWTVTLMGAGCNGGRPRFLPAMRGDGMAAGSWRVGRGGEWLIPGAVGQPGAGRKKKRAFYSIFHFMAFPSTPSSSTFPHTVILSFTVDHKATTNMLQASTHRAIH